MQQKLWIKYSKLNWNFMWTAWPGYRAIYKDSLISESLSELTTTNSIHHHKDKLYVILWIETDFASWMAFYNHGLSLNWQHSLMTKEFNLDVLYKRKQLDHLGSWNIKALDKQSQSKGKKLRAWSNHTALHLDMSCWMQEYSMH